MTVGKKYRVFHKSSQQKFVRFSIMTFLGSTQTGELQFSARPVGGTQTLPREWYISHEEVPMNTPHVLNKRA